MTQNLNNGTVTSPATVPAQQTQTAPIVNTLGVLYVSFIHSLSTITSTEAK